MLIGQLFNGLVIGCMYALVAAGMTLVLGTLDRLNLAHTEVFAAGGFGAVLATGAGVSVWWGLPIAFLVGGILGVLVEFISFRKFISQDARITAALSSLAFGLVLIDLSRKVWGGEPLGLSLSGGAFAMAFEFSGVRFSWLQFVIVGVALLLCAGLHLAVNYTDFGRRVRAVAESPPNAALLGVNVVRVAQTVFFVSSALAAVAGLLVALRTASINADIGLSFGLKAIAIMAIGGMGDLRGALLAGLLVGVMEALLFHFGLGRLGEMAVWVLMVLLILWRPGGIFGSGSHGREQRV